MKTPFALLIAWGCLGGSASAQWLSVPAAGYNLYYTEKDTSMAAACAGLLDSAGRSVQAFFGKPILPGSFNVYLYPDRAALDTQWQHDWQMPDFHSECWMVASGVATRFDLLSPRSWEMDACEHRYADTIKTRQLLAHELVHVFHGQHNASPDFSDITGLDWLVEGLATYASGQCDSARFAEVRQAVLAGKATVTLDDFWKGRLRYGLSGSMVMYIDRRWGRDRLINLLPLNRKEAVLQALGLTEEALLQGWREWIRS